MSVERSFSAKEDVQMEEDDDIRQYLTSNQEADLNKINSNSIIKSRKTQPIKIIKNKKIKTSFIEKKQQPSTLQEEIQEENEEDDNDEEERRADDAPRAFVSGTVGEISGKKRGRKPKKDVVETREDVLRKKRKKFAEILVDFSEAYPDGSIDIHVKIPAVNKST